MRTLPIRLHPQQDLRRWADEIAARPAVIRGRKVNRVFGNPDEQVAERHDAADLD